MTANRWEPRASHTTRLRADESAHEQVKRVAAVVTQAEHPELTHPSDATPSLAFSHHGDAQ